MATKTEQAIQELEIAIEGLRVRTDASERFDQNANDELLRMRQSLSKLSEENSAYRTRIEHLEKSREGWTTFGKSLLLLLLGTLITLIVQTTKEQLANKPLRSPPGAAPSQ